jgi:hypothetical protein
MSVFFPREERLEYKGAQWTCFPIHASGPILFYSILFYSILFYSTLKLPSFNLFCRSLSLPCSYALLCEYYKKGFCQIFSKEPHGTAIKILFINEEPY